jgi:hypothetical protein
MAGGQRLVILHLPSQSPWWIKDAATAALVLHIGGASVGLVAGAVALAVKKGGLLHRRAGDAFVVAMLTMTTVAAIMAPLIHQPANSVMAAFTFYLVATGWVTMRRPAGEVGRLEAAAMLIALAPAALGLWMAWAVAPGPASAIERTVACLMTAVAVLAAGLDLRVILHGGISGARRLARHLWRMCAGLFIATGSFFLGQQQVLPHVMRGSPLLFIPAFAPLALMVFWLVRVRAAGRTGAERAKRLALGAGLR